MTDSPHVRSDKVKRLAREAGFELVGVAGVEPTLESLFYSQWLERGYHGKMEYLEGRRGEMRADPRSLLPSARSILSLGVVYNAAERYSTEFHGGDAAWVSRYAWGQDYHRVLKDRLHELVSRMQVELGEFNAKVCVDTSPLLERAYAHHAGLGWIGKNTCLINESLGSWLFLAEVLTSLELSPDAQAPFRCGTCTRCIDACPTDAFVELEPEAGPSHALDSRRCISYWTIELGGEIPEPNRAEIGHHLFGCDICQDVCPWNRVERAAVTAEQAFLPRHAEPDPAELAAISEEEFNDRFADSPIERSRYRGFLRNLALVMGNSGNVKYLEPLCKLATYEDAVVSEHARWAIDRLSAHADRA